MFGLENIDRDVAGQRIDFFETGEVVVGGALDRRVEVLADVDAEDAALFQEIRRLDVGDQPVDARVVESHAVDDRPASPGCERGAGAGCRAAGAA